MFKLACRVFKMRVGILMFTKSTNQSKVRDVWQICLPESMVQRSRVYAIRVMQGDTRE